jgi:hypothetical protein
VFEQITDADVWRGFWIGMLMHLIQIPLSIAFTLIGNRVVPRLEIPLGIVCFSVIGATQFLFWGR